MPGALQDLRVIDFTHALAGPFCVMLLGHLGAFQLRVDDYALPAPSSPS